MYIYLRYMYTKRNVWVKVNYICTQYLPAGVYLYLGTYITTYELCIWPLFTFLKTVHLPRCYNTKCLVLMLQENLCLLLKRVTESGFIFTKFHQFGCKNKNCKRRKEFSFLTLFDIIIMLILNPALETQNTTHRYTIFTKSAGFYDEGWFSSWRK